MPTLQEIHDTVGGELRGDGAIEITGVQSLADAGPSEIAPFDDANYAAAAQASGAAALIVTPKLADKLADKLDRPMIVHEYALAAMNGVIEMLGLAAAPQTPGVHPSAVIDPTAHVPESCTIGPSVVIGANARLGERCILHPNVTLERGVIVGDDCTIDPCATLHEGTEVGNRVAIGTGAIISRRGFGWTVGPKGPLQVHHVGKVIIGDDTSIGQGCNIDRARFGATRVGTMTALDFAVHMAHNTRVGDGSFISGQVGIAGHGFVGNDCQLGGQVGIGPGCGVGDHSRVGGQAGVTKDLGPNRTVKGSPATDLKTVLRMEAVLRRLAQPKKRGTKEQG